MGMYTELALSAELVEGVDEEVVSTLKSMVDGEGVTTNPWGHRLFGDSRWRWMLASGGSYYFPQVSYRSFAYDEISRSWHLGFQTNIKNYDHEWELLLDWLGPYCQRGHGHYMYEEDDFPTPVVWKDGAFWFVGTTGILRPIDREERTGMTKVWNLTEHFSVAELQCRDGTPVPDEFVTNAQSICQRAEVLRSIAGPLIVTSGYRTAEHNRKVGGAAKSMHLTASALDLKSRLHTGPELALMYLDLIDRGRVPDGGVGRYPGWVHIDLGRGRRWG